MVGDNLIVIAWSNNNQTNESNGPDYDFTNFFRPPMIFIYLFIIFEYMGLEDHKNTYKIIIYHLWKCIICVN
jgi:hypothetical protein